MSLKPYPKYKDSGVEWLGEVPEHWQIGPVKSVAHIINGYPFDSDLFDPAVGIPLVRIRDVGRSEAETYYIGDHIDAAAITSDDVLIGMDGEFNVGRWKGTGVAMLNQRVCCVRSNSTAIKRLLEYVLPQPLKIINHATYSTTVKHLSSYQVEKIRFSLPPTEEESLQIVHFLDRETAKIDALIAEQEKLITLLTEKRQATISHAVTKGLNPDAKMKDSGVEWLGEVPEHWDIVSVGYRYDVQLGKMLDSAKVTGNHLRPYLRVFDVQWRKINTEDLPVMDFDEDAQARYRLVSGDLLVNEGGSYVGRSAIWHGDLAECYYQKALHRLRALDASKDTAQYMLNVMEFATNYGVFIAGGNQTTIDHLTAEQFRRYRFAFPPLAEQHQISSYLNDKMMRLETLSQEAQSVVNLLKERRISLISAAVTGKIDVRGVVEAESAAA